MRGRDRLHKPSRSASRRPGTIPGRRFALALALILLAFPGGTASADQSSGQRVTAIVYSPGQSPTQDSISVGELAADSKCQRYSGSPGVDLQGPGTPPGQTFTQLSWSLPTVLECLSVPVHTSDVTSITVRQTDGSPETSAASQLSRADLVTPSDFSDPSAVPVIWSDGSNLLYYRPPRDGGDQNARDLVEQPKPAPLAIDVFEGPPLSVAATASQTTVRTGATVDFGATVTPSSAAGLSYNWVFGDGSPNSTSASPQHSFASAGKYNVTVEASDAAGGGGGDTLQITVTEPNGPPPRSGNQSTPGPNASGGKNPGGSAGNQNGKPQGGGNHNFGGSGSSGRHDAKNPAAASNHKRKHARSTHPSTAPASSGTQGPSSQTTGGSSSTPSSSSPTTPAPVRGTPHSSPSVKQPRSKQPRPAPQSALITGRLISDVTPLPADASPLVHIVPAQIASAPARRVVRTSLARVLAAALAIVLLLGLGARRELRGRRDWRAFRFGS